MAHFCVALWGIWISIWSLILNAGNVDMNFVFCQCPLIIFCCCLADIPWVHTRRHLWSNHRVTSRTNHIDDILVKAFECSYHFRIFRRNRTRAFVMALDVPLSLWCNKYPDTRRKLFCSFREPDESFLWSYYCNRDIPGQA